MDRKEAIDVMQNNLEWGECYDFEEAATTECANCWKEWLQSITED